MSSSESGEVLKNMVFHVKGLTEKREQRVKEQQHHVTGAIGAFCLLWGGNQIVFRTNKVTRTGCY